MLAKRALLVAIMVLSSTLTASLLSPQMSASGLGTDDVADLARMERTVSTAHSLASIAQSHPAYRVAGSQGANETADYILQELSGLGLDAWKESIPFQTWDLRAKATLSVDADGNDSTTGDIITFSSFLAESWSTPLTSNQSADVVVLPLPVMSTRADWEWLSFVPIGYWNDLNLTGKVVVVPREIRWNTVFEARFAHKVSVEKPLGVVFVYGFGWDSWAPDMSQSSSGGMPLSQTGDYLNANQIAAGSLNYSEGSHLLALGRAGNATARMYLPSMIASGNLTNVVAVLPGTTSKEVLVTAHYDSVMSAGYMDNAGGVAALLETARCMVEAKQQGWTPECTVRFIAFTGEEMFLMGSAVYVRQHSAEMANVKAVINLDCLGGEQLVVSRPVESAKLQMVKIVMREANRLGVDIAEYEGEGGSDHYSFQHPLDSILTLNNLWHTSISTNDLVYVPDAVMISSEPLTIFDSIDGNIGLIHTTLDRPDAVPDYMNDTRFFEQTRVAISAVAVLAQDVEGPVIKEGIDATLFVVVGFVVVALIVILAYASLRKQKKG
jgi:hypothetical protein